MSNIPVQYRYVLKNWLKANKECRRTCKLQGFLTMLATPTDGPAIRTIVNQNDEIIFGNHTVDLKSIDRQGLDDYA